MNPRTAALGIAFSGLFWLGVMVLAVVGCSRREIPTTQTQPPLQVWVPCVGKSMLPTFPESSLVELEVGVPYDQIKAGDTCAFWDYTTGILIHHRAVQKQGGAWIMRGDNPETNPRADRPWMTRDNYYGRTTGRHAQFLVAPQT